MNAYFPRIAHSLSSQRNRWQPLILLLFVLIFIGLSLARPKLEWDMIAYVAIAKNIIAEQPIEQLQTEVYSELKAEVPAEDFARLTSTENSRDIIASDPEAFHQHITFFYDTRVVYTWLIAGAIKLGIEPFFATSLISTLAAALAIVFLTYLLPIHVPYGLLFSILPIALANGLFLVARYSTPDALAALCTVFIYWCLLRHKKILLLLLPFSILIRTDMIILAAIVCAYLLLINRHARILVIISGAATVLTYLLLSYVVFEHDLWSSVIGYNYDEKPSYAQDYSFDISIGAYLDALKIGILSFSYQPMFLVFLIMLINGAMLFASQIFRRVNSGEQKLQQDLLFVLISCAAYVGLHFLLFPEPWLRFFAAQYSIVMVVVVWANLVGVRVQLPSNESIDRRR